MASTKYYIMGMRPVYFEREDDGKLKQSYAFNWSTGEFDLDYDCWLRIIFGKVDELEELNESEFWEYVDELKHKHDNS